MTKLEVLNLESLVDIRSDVSVLTKLEVLNLESLGDISSDVSVLTKLCSMLSVYFNMHPGIYFVFYM